MIRRAALSLLPLLLVACADETNPTAAGDINPPLVYHANNHIAATTPQNIRQNLDSSEALVPYQDAVTYPDNWPDLTRRRNNIAP